MEFRGCDLLSLLIDRIDNRQHFGRANLRSLFLRKFQNQAHLLDDFFFYMLGHIPSALDGSSNKNHILFRHMGSCQGTLAPLPPW